MCIRDSDWDNGDGYMLAHLGKTALLPGQTATFANLTSYIRGINGMVIDIAGLPGTPTAADFVFRVGTDANPATWPVLSGDDLPTVSVRPGAGSGGSDRVTFIWAADKAPKNAWLQCEVLATANTGLANKDTCYIGNLVGETGRGNTASLASVSIFDVNRTVASYGTTNAGITDPTDFNRTDVVDIFDVNTVVASYTATLMLFTTPVPPDAPAAPGTEASEFTPTHEPGMEWADEAVLTAPEDSPAFVDAVFSDESSWSGEDMWLAPLDGASTEAEEEDDVEEEAVDSVLMFYGSA